MNHELIALVALFILLFGAISGRISTLPFTPPMAFVLFGFVIGAGGLGIFDAHIEHGFIHLIAELTLVMVLFVDASRIDLGRLRREHNLPVRMLSIGLPLTIVLGALAARWLFPELPVWQAVLLGIILAPTDAALGQAVVSSEKTPVRIRQALNVESGLNDGLALPVLLFFLCLAMMGHDDTNWLLLAGKQLTLGPLVGIGVGYFGGKLVDKTSANHWMNESFQGLSAIGLALLAFAGAEYVGGNGFLAAFCAGLLLGHTTKNTCKALYEFGEAEGQLLTLITFLIFGALMLPEALSHATLNTFIYAILSLTLIRIVPVVLSLLGTGIKPATFAFLGWFGPRGVASIIYVLLVLEEPMVQMSEELANVTSITVLLSVVLHGLTAVPAVNWYAKHLKSSDDACEHQQVSEMPLRLSDSKG